MKKTDYENFKLSLNISIDIDSSLRHITEKIKLLSQMRNTTALEKISSILSIADSQIDDYFESDILVDNE